MVLVRRADRLSYKSAHPEAMRVICRRMPQRGEGRGAMRRRDLLAAAGSIVVSGAIGERRAWGQDKKVLKASDVHPEGYPTVQAVENMSKKLEQATNGRLSIQMYASMQLGGE